MNSSAECSFDGSAFQRLCQDPETAAVAAELLWQANAVEDVETFLTAALRSLSAATGTAKYVAVAAAEAGSWTVLADQGEPRSLPVDLLAEVLDREAAERVGSWVAAPLHRRSAVAEVVVFYGDNVARARQCFMMLEPVAPFLGGGLRAVRNRLARFDRQQRRLGRLEALWEIARRWNQHREMEPLLSEIAETATRLLDADRASIFLWDRPNKTLVGRPALGVEASELRIPDDVGLVGQVIKSGKPQRADATINTDKIDHQFDAQLGYRTKSLLCVPLRSCSGELFGAFEILNKHVGVFTDGDEAALTDLAEHATTALENAQDREKLLSANRQFAEEAAQHVRLIGESPAMDALRSVVGRVADTDLAVLVLGENGTGKEVVARSIHFLSRRRDKPFIAINCAAIPDSLAESELFGHEKGAFTDAQEARPGKFELAAEGTLFLDEIGDLSLSGQAKLLRVSEEKVLVRVGGSTPIHSDARVVAATNQDLAEMVRQKRFREDLYFRLNVVTLDVPALRERPDDILLLAKHFLDDFSKKARRKTPKITDEARRRLEQHPWPGNVRELRNLMERLAYLSTEDHIDADDLSFILVPGGSASRAPQVDRALADATIEFQVDYINRAIEQADGNVSQAATQLGLHRSNLYRKMRQLGMSVPR